MNIETRAFKIAVAYLVFVVAVVGGAFYTFQSVIVGPATAASSSQAVAAQARTPARFAARQDDGPMVDPKDPKLFDARGEFPKSMRDAMAIAKRESMRAVTPVKVATPKPVQRKVRRERPQSMPQEIAQGYSQGYSQVQGRGDSPGFGFNAFAW